MENILKSTLPDTGAGAKKCTRCDGSGIVYVGTWPPIAQTCTECNPIRLGATDEPYFNNGSTAPTAVFPEGAFAIVEIMGHQKVAGRIHQVQFGSAALLQICIPELPALPAQDEPGLKSTGAIVKVRGRYTRAAVPARPAGVKLYSLSAVFGMTLCTEADALADEEDRREKPYTVFVPDPGEESKMPKRTASFVPDYDEDCPDPFAEED